MTAVAVENPFNALDHQSQIAQIIRILKTNSGISGSTKGFMHKISKGVKTLKLSIQNSEILPDNWRKF